MTLRSDHDVGLVQHKHPDLLGVDELELEAPVQHGSRRADHDLLLKLHAPLYWRRYIEHTHHHHHQTGEACNAASLRKLAS